jgi:hypothetical protein
MFCCAVYKTKTARLKIVLIEFDYQQHDSNARISQTPNPKPQTNHIEFKASARRPGTMGVLDWIAMSL